MVTLNAMIWAVIVVPMFAPMITPIDWESDIRPELMKPTTKTVVTLDDCMTAVIPAPVTIPMNRLVVRRPRMRRIRSPATAFSDSVRWSMPNRNTASPPKSPIRRTGRSMPSVTSWAATASV